MKKFTIAAMAAVCAVSIIACNKSGTSKTSTSYEHEPGPNDVIITDESTSDAGQTQEPETQEPITQEPVTQEPDTQEATTSYVEPTTVDLVMIGDMLMHGSASTPALQADGSYNYDYLFANVKDDIMAADVAVVNQEVIFAGNELGNQGWPSFTVRTEQGDALVNNGFDVVLQATNHTTDWAEGGIVNTLNYWKNNHPETTVLGIHESQEAADAITIYESNGVKIAMFNFTYGVNGHVPDDKKYLVDVLSAESMQSIAENLAKAREMADFVVVFPHWGSEYSLAVTQDQRNWAQYFANNGADLIIGTHPHVLEAVEWVTATDGRNVLCYYSLGNFVSIQYHNTTMLGGMAKVEISKDSAGTRISNYDMDFLVTHYVPGRSVVTTYFLDDYTDELAATHAILTEPYTGDAAAVANYHAWNDPYPFCVATLKALAETICPDLADY